MTDYRAYGSSHGAAMFWDISKPNSDLFLAYMERRLPAHGLESYLDGFADGIMGECKQGNRQMRGFAKVGSE